MIKITIFYPVNKDDWFDMDYYLQKHVPLSKSVFGDSLKGLAIEEACLSEEAKSENFPYKVIGHLFFEKAEDFYSRFLSKKELLEEDAKNYTNVSAIVQVSKVITWELFGKGHQNI